MIRAAFIVLAFGISAVVEAQLPSPPPDIAADNVLVDRYPVQNVTFPNGVRGLPGVIYSKPVGFRPLTLDLYLPLGSVDRPSSGFPLVVFIHGGAWMSGDSHSCARFSDFPGVLATLSAKGYVVASINYRLSGEAKFPAQVIDAKASIRWLKLNASRYGIDPTHAVVWGASAGAHLAGLVATSRNVGAFEPEQGVELRTSGGNGGQIPSPDASGSVQGCVLWYGVFDMATIAAQAKQDRVVSHVLPETERQLLGCVGVNECDPERVAAASPVTYVNSKCPPTLLITGTEDTLVPYHQTLEMAERLKSAGVRCELVLLPGINHAFVGKTFEQTRDASLKALATTFRFIDETIGKGSNANQ